MAASLILRQLASYPRQNGLAAALRELGRLERTLFTLDWKPFHHGRLEAFAGFENVPRIGEWRPAAAPGRSLLR